ncbi:glycoside hydrolase family 3 N-terminal domain-containing protein [Limnofasciculus baicalensis]|uniref:beta-N-acetylhexosaminidase n=1 Tax=Limnofasciculus baicalensis BBK-W-15 TaxID=2699891 RepID=A0AAE3KTX7_9CYAN|nr:glycoside hydrolase family 3 N-terminal domain-containing protein [Limnofasciculus baicalensis]MCP2730952.1 beta-glucosidase [Limnofasciculus baicalensis BBK-W-15]
MTNHPSAISLPTLDSLSLEALVAQMVVIRASGYLFDRQIQYPIWEPPTSKLQHWIEDLGVGGVILLGGSAVELKLRSQQLQGWAQIPLLVAADIEEGVGQRFSGATWFPPPMAIGAVALKDMAKAQQYAQEMGNITAQEALAIGINWILAPVVDVNNNPQNPVINVRAFGETPETVSQLATAFIRGTQDYPVLTTAKHFPGHGDTATDSHLDLPILPHSLSRLHQIELPPFQAAISAGVDTVMTAHLLIPTLDEEYPATLSKPVLTDLLRQELGFDGLIVTDALVMGAIANRYGADEAAVMAVEAGADILLMPVNPETAISAVCEAVKTGRISQERILSSVERIWQAKGKVMDSFHLKSSTENFLAQVAQPAAFTTVNNILRDSLKIGGSLPLAPQPTNSNRQLRNLILVDDVLACDFLGRNAPAINIPKQLGYQLQWVDRDTLPRADDTNHLPGSQPTLLQLFIRGNPFRGTAEMMTRAEIWVKKLLKTNDLQVLVIYGSPYVLEQFQRELPPATPYPYLYSYGQMAEAQSLAMDRLFSQTALRSGLTEFV